MSDPKNDPNERIRFDTEQAVTEEPEVEGHRAAFGTEQPDERAAFGTEHAASAEEQPDVTGHRALATEDPEERAAFGTEPPA